MVAGSLRPRKTSRATSTPSTRPSRGSSRTSTRNWSLPEPKSSTRAASACSPGSSIPTRSEEHTSELQSRLHLVCRLLLEKKKNRHTDDHQPCRHAAQSLPVSAHLKVG